MSKKKKRTVNFKLKTKLHYLYFSIVLIFACFAFLVGYLVYFADKVPYNTYFGSTNISALSKSELQKVITERSNDFLTHDILISVNGSEVPMHISDFAKIDSVMTTVKIFNDSHRDDLFLNGAIRFRSLFKRTDVEPVYKIDFDKLANFVDSKLSLVSNEAVSASVVFSGGDWGVREARNGTVVDLNKFYTDVKERILTFDESGIQLSEINASPIVSTEDARDALVGAQNLQTKKIVLSFDTDSWSLTGANLQNVLSFHPEGFEGDNFATVTIADRKYVIEDMTVDGQSDSRKLALGLNSGKISDFTDQIATVVNKPTVDATLKFVNGKVSEFKPAQNGQRLDTVQTNQLILAAISDTQATKPIVLPVLVSAAKIASDEINSLGIKELVGRGVSYFAGSIPNRAFNVGLGTSRITGALIKPGETFSFNKTVGEVSGVTGYKQAYVISAGHTVLDDGGGICQVSTTVFRAALNAGLPIVSRTAHAYRVGYYEQHGIKPGFDATVFAPSVDFQFKNDTNHHLLLQATIDPATSKLEVDLYGTLDGRRVVISDPVVSNQSPAPPDKFQDDPTLPVGTTKQVDFAAAGATVSFSRQVYRGNSIVLDESFRSNYRPWQAVFLVGKKT